MQRHFRISAVLAVAISALFFLSATLTTQAAQKKLRYWAGRMACCTWPAETLSRA